MRSIKEIVHGPRVLLIKKNHSAARLRTPIIIIMTFQSDTFTDTAKRVYSLCRTEHNAKVGVVQTASPSSPGRVNGRLDARGVEGGSQVQTIKEIVSSRHLGSPRIDAFFRRRKVSLEELSVKTAASAAPNGCH